MKKALAISIVISVVVIAGISVAWMLTKKETPLLITNFEECAKAGNPIMESYPRRCQYGEQTFTENIVNLPGGGTESPKACTMEAKLCPDGSAVGRTGPNCEFAQCPAINPEPVNAEKQCAGPGDTSCPVDYECVEGCGPPVVRYPNNTPPSYFCQPKGYIRNCPICLSENTLIDTPLGAIPVQNVKKGMPVWTISAAGKRVPGVVIETGNTRVPPGHKMVALILDDGRTLLVSPGHPTVDRRTAGDLIAGDLYDGARVVSSKQVLYDNGFTYDILPSGETGFYWANKILLDTTLKQ